MASQKKTIKNVYSISSTETVLEYSNGSWAIQSISNNQVTGTSTISKEEAKKKLAGIPNVRKPDTSFTVKSVARVSQTESLIQKDDGSWVLRKLGLNNDVVSEQPVSASEAKRLLANAPGEAQAQRGRVTGEGRTSASPGGAAPATVRQLEANVRALENTRRNAEGDYWLDGRWVLPSEFTARLNDAKDRLANARGMVDIGGQRAQIAEQQTTATAADQSIALGQILVQLQTKESYVDQVIATSKNRDDVSRARAWKKDLQSRASSIRTYLDKLNRTKTVDPTFVAPEVPTDQQLEQTNPEQISAGAGTTGRVTSQMPSVVAERAVPTAPPAPGTSSMGTMFPSLAGASAGQPGTTPATTPVTAPATSTTPAATTTTTGQIPAGTPTVPGGGSAGGTVGGTPSGTVPPAAGTPTSPAGGLNIPADWEKAAREAYGSYYDAIKNIPELRDFINELMSGPILSDPQFKAKLQQTNWWKTTTAAARDFVRRQVEDPATLQTQIDNSKADMRQRALALGLSVDDATLTKVVTDQIKFGWGEQVTLDYLGQQSLGTTEGAARLRQGFYGQQVREKAAQYGIPLSDVTFTNWVSKIATGSENLTSFETYVREQAKVLYPALSNGLDRGLSFTDLTSPYAVQASRILEIPAEQIDFSDPRWARAFTSRNDKGEQTQMSYGEWADYLRSDPSFGWEYTDQAKSQAYDIALEIGRMFGRAG